MNDLHRLNTYAMLDIYTRNVTVNTPKRVNGQPLRMVAKRYSLTPKSCDEGVTLLLVHGLGTRKHSFRGTYVLLAHKLCR